MKLSLQSKRSAKRNLIFTAWSTEPDHNKSKMCICGLITNCSWINSRPFSPSRKNHAGYFFYSLTFITRSPFWHWIYILVHSYIICNSKMRMWSNILFLFFEEKDKKVLVVTQVMLKLKIKYQFVRCMFIQSKYWKVELTLTSVHAKCQQM